MPSLPPWRLVPNAKLSLPEGQKDGGRDCSGLVKGGEVAIESNVWKTHFANADRPTALYSLDMILAVGYRVNSSRGIIFRR